jgi:hypothetical protein
VDGKTAWEMRGIVAMRKPRRVNADVTWLRAQRLHRKALAVQSQVYVTHILIMKQSLDISSNTLTWHPWSLLFFALNCSLTNSVNRDPLHSHPD